MMFKRRSNKPKQMHGFLIDDEFNTQRFRDWLRKASSHKEGK